MPSLLFPWHPDNGDRHQQEAEEAKERTDHDPAGAEHIGIEFHTAATAAHQQEADNDQGETSAHHPEIRLGERALIRCHFIE